jgi:alpha-L-fucosidase
VGCCGAVRFLDDTSGFGLRGGVRGAGEQKICARIGAGRSPALAPARPGGLAYGVKTTEPHSLPSGLRGLIMRFWLPLALLLASLPGAATHAAVAPPPPCGAVPSARQLAWHELEFYGFIHFTVNTFTDKEWGYGDEAPDVFNPTAFDARQWARVAREAGMKGLILTAKHHDGFCLWPSAYTEHSVKKSRWQNGQGDVVKALSEACRKEGIKFGVYLSPWDRNHASYSKPEYLTYYRNQLRELLTRYGPIFEVWFDGANGGDGFYGGAKEQRRIDNRTYYDWPNIRALVRELQPQAVMFSDGGPDVRWVGNESGWAFSTNWMAMNLGEVYPGMSGFEKFAPGRPDGTDWCPPEVDVSIRPGWFYHPAEDAKVKTAAKLMEIYYNSVGRGANLLLNLPPDRRGRIHETDAANLREFRRMLDATFKTDLARSAKATATARRLNGPTYNPDQLNDGKPNTCWATDDGVTTASATLEFKRPARFDRVVIQEYLALGQRVEAWSVEAEVDGQWKSIATGSTLGYKRILRCEPVTATKVRLNILQARACPMIATLGLYLSP